MIYAISIETFGEYNVHDIQSNSAWCSCPLPGYAQIPSNLVDGILATCGFCDIVLNDDQTEVVSFTAREKPVIPECSLPSIILTPGVDYGPTLPEDGTQGRLFFLKPQEG